MLPAPGQGREAEVVTRIQIITIKWVSVHCGQTYTHPPWGRGGTECEGCFFKDVAFEQVWQLWPGQRQEKGEGVLVGGTKK